MRGAAEIAPAKVPPGAPAPSPIERAAIILTAVGPEIAAGMLKDMNSDSLTRFARVVSRLGNVSPELLNKVIVDFAEALARGGELSGGASAARRLLEAVLDEGALAAALGEDGPPEAKVWEQLGSVGVPALGEYLAHEHPQTAAVILSELKPDLAATILERLDPVFARDVVLRLARVPTLDPAVFDMLAQALHRDFLSVARQGAEERRPADLLADLMNNVSSEARDGFLTHLEGEAPDLASDVQRSMFTFDHISTRLAARDVGVVIRELPEDVILTALKFGEMQASDSVGHILRNLPRRLGERLAEDLAAMSEVSRKDGEAAHIEITRRVLALKKAGAISFLASEGA